MAVLSFQQEYAFINEHVLITHNYCWTFSFLKLLKRYSMRLLNYYVSTRRWVGREIKLASETYTTFIFHCQHGARNLADEKNVNVYWQVCLLFTHNGWLFCWLFFALICFYFHLYYCCNINFLFVSHLYAHFWWLVDCTESIVYEKCRGWKYRVILKAGLIHFSGFIVGKILVYTSIFVY